MHLKFVPACLICYMPVNFGLRVSLSIVIRRKYSTEHFQRLQNDTGPGFQKKSLFRIKAVKEPFSVSPGLWWVFPVKTGFSFFYLLLILREIDGGQIQNGPLEYTSHKIQISAFGKIKSKFGVLF